MADPDILAYGQCERRQEESYRGDDCTEIRSRDAYSEKIEQDRQIRAYHQECSACRALFPLLVELHFSVSFFYFGDAMFELRPLIHGKCLKEWWAWLELNQRPIGYEPTALTSELQAQKTKKMAVGGGFGPPRHLTAPYRFSKPASSAT